MTLPHIRKDPRSLTNLPEILSCLSLFQSEEAELSNSLAQLLKAKEPINISLARLQSLSPRLDELQLEANSLTEKVTNTAKTAETVGRKVLSLDEEMGRIREASDRVAQVMDLKSSLSALQISIESRDWESAAIHCARAMSVPTEVVAGSFAGIAVPTSDSHLPPSQTLQAAREKLLSVFRQSFVEASRARDSSAISRYFKLFPAIGWETEGLEVYANFVVDLVRINSPLTTKSSSPLYYVTTLTSLLESVAMVVAQHQPLVDKYYGTGKMRKVVHRIMDEVDRLTANLKNSWEEERSMTRKLAEVSNNPISSSSTRRQVPEDGLVDHREIDKILSEMAALIGRWNLFRKFLNEELKENVVKSSDGLMRVSFEKASASKEQEDVLASSASHAVFEQLISTYYIPLEVWYTRTIIDKAHRLSTPDLLQSPVISTTPDDVFYIFKSVTTRLLSTGSLTGIERTTKLLREIIDRDYIAIVKRKLDDVYKGSGPMTSNVWPDKVEKENRFSFIMLLNDFDISTSHLDRLIHDLLDSPLIIQHFAEEEQITVKDYISTLSSSIIRMKSSLKSGIEQIFNQLMRPKLRNFLPDIYKDISYILDEEGYATAEYHDVARKRFIKAWELLVEGYKETFSERNYRLFIGLVLDMIIRPWEKFVMSLKYTELGAVRFDRDLRSIIAYIASQTTFGEIREKFLRMQQISTLLNLDADEDIDEFFNGSGISWRIGANEARMIASLKI